MEWLTMANASAVVQIAFWLTLGGVGLVSYRQASKTIFLPFRNEIFKRQLDLAEEIVRFVTARPPEWDNFLRITGLQDVIGANLLARLEDESLDRGFLSRSEIDALELPSFEEADESSALWANVNVRALWPADMVDAHRLAAAEDLEDWEPSAVWLPSRHHHFLRQLAQYASNPLLHPAWVQALRALEHDLGAASTLVGDVVEEAARALRVNQGDDDDFLAGYFAGNHNRCLQRIREAGLDVEGRRKAVIEVIRSTLATDDGWGFEIK